jgi:hypothetical protein
MKAKVPKAMLIAFVGACVAIGLACQRNHSGLSNSDQQRMEEFRAKRESRTRELKAMDVRQLAAVLETESENGREWFNSMAYVELTSRGKEASPALVSVLKKEDRSSFSGMMALRKIDPESYHALSSSFRTHVFIDAFKSSKYFNAWGIPTLYWTDASKALIEEGAPAEVALKELLRDTRPAPVWGSEGVMVSQQYHFRVCDYAWALLAEMKKSPLQIPENPEERDKLIRAVK